MAIIRPSEKKLGKFCPCTATRCTVQL